VRALGFLQIDTVAPVAPPQYLVLWSRLGPYDTDELDRLLWQERKLFEWNAFIWPIEDLPFVQARMRRRRNKYTWERRGNEFLRTNVRARRYVLRELERRGRCSPASSKIAESLPGVRRMDGGEAGPSP
jgi:uncharacterized protein YcaQ